jgi:hypothetical protein
VVKTVELPEKKKEKYLERLSTWTHGLLHTAREAECLIGTLNHICLVIPEGRSHMVTLYKFRGGFKTGHAFEARHKLPPQAGDDTTWWRIRLQGDFVGMKITHPPKPLDTILFVDASTQWGIGLVINGRWLAWQLKDGWNSEGHEIGWAEMVAVELAIQTLVTAKFTNCHIIMHSDNKGMVGVLQAGCSRGTQQNSILHEIVKLIQDNDLWISTIWIPTLENPVDGPSRGNFPGKNSIYAFTPKLPFHLTKLVHRAVSYDNVRLQ